MEVYSKGFSHSENGLGRVERADVSPSLTLSFLTLQWHAAPQCTEMKVLWGCNGVIRAPVLTWQIFIFLTVPAPCSPSVQSYISVLNLLLFLNLQSPFLGQHWADRRDFSEGWLISDDQQRAAIFFLRKCEDCVKEPQQEASMTISGHWAPIRLRGISRTFSSFKMAMI